MTRPQVRPLNPSEWEAFRLARLGAAERFPYLMHAVFAVSPVAAPGLGTFAVDAAWRLYIDPARLVGEDRWSTPDTAGVLLHEVNHLLRDHAGRAENLPHPVSRLGWNLAGDAEINDDLLGAGIPLPGECVTPSALGCPDGDLAEAYYATLMQDADEEGLPDDDSGGCGSGAGSDRAPGELPEGVALSDGTAEPITPAEGGLVRRRVAQAIQDTEASKGRGTVPGSLVRWAAATLAPPTVAWDQVLRASLRRAIADMAGRVDYTYTRPSRRQVPGIIRPALRAPAVIVSIVVDTSGSMSQADLDAAMGELQGVLRSSGVARNMVRMVSCDAAATTARRVQSATSVELTGGGGTDMRVGIATAEAASPPPHVVVVLTDGGTPWPDEPGRARLVCAVITQREPVGTPAWATTVHIPPRTVSTDN